MSAEFAERGVLTVPDVVDADECALLRERSDRWLNGGAGTRSLLHKFHAPTAGEHKPIVALARRLMGHPALRGCLPADPVAVQCTFFRKVPARNWFVPWHQDGSLPCRTGQGEVDPSRWSVKEGESFVEAPAEVLETITAVRIHLDDSRAENGPLLVWPGSHREGLLREAELNGRAPHEPAVPCLVPAGGALVMRPLLVHSSRKSVVTANPRRVLHFVFGPRRPPLGLAWNVAVGPEPGA